MAQPNSLLNINRSFTDKYTFLLSDIPSSELLFPDNIKTDLEGMMYKFNDINYFGLSLQSVDLPGITLNEIKIDSTFVPIAETDMVMQFDPLTTELRLDKDWKIYHLILLWIYLRKNPEGYNQFDMGETHKRTAVNGTILVNDTMTNSPISGFEFYDLKPQSIPTIELSYATDDEIVLPVTWSYSYWMPIKKNGMRYNLTLKQ